MNTFEEEVQKIWSITNVDEKRSLLLDIVDNFQYKKQTSNFRIAIIEAPTAARLDKIATNILLADMKVIK